MKCLLLFITISFTWNIQSQCNEANFYLSSDTLRKNEVFEFGFFNSIKSDSLYFLVQLECFDSIRNKYINLFTDATVPNLRKTIPFILLKDSIKYQFLAKDYFKDYHDVLGKDDLLQFNVSFYHKINGSFQFCRQVMVKCIYMND